MIQTQHDERRKRELLTQREVCQIAGCSPGNLQYHARQGWIQEPTARLHARFYYTIKQAEEIAAYFATRKRWERGGDKRGVDQHPPRASKDTTFKQKGGEACHGT